MLYNISYLKEGNEMPPKVKYTRELIVNAATELVKEAGASALTARALGERLNCSVAPIFSVFKNMEDVQSEVVKAAKKIYDGYIEEGLKQVLPFKGAGLKYIEFARREPNLFRLLFMSQYPVGLDGFMLLDENNDRILNALITSWGVDGEIARQLHEDIMIYTHGIAVLCVTNSCSFSDEEISRRLTAAFTAMLKEVKSK